MVFSVSYDRTTWIVSAAVCVASAFLAMYSWWIACLLFAITGLVGAWSPRGYVVSEDAIRVKRLIGPATVPLAGVREARRAAPGDLCHAVRLFGSGGLFGYFGLFRTTRLGTCHWYVTDRSKAVVVVAAKTAVFSPDDVDGFLAAIRAVAPVPPAPAPPVEAGWPWRAVFIGAGAGAAVAGLVFFSLYYSPGLPAYTLTRDTLAIHDKFYPVTLGARDVDVEGIRVVDLREEACWRSTLRTNGFANLRYRSGWFRTANGKSVRLYRASGERLVLLPAKGDGAPLLYEVKDPDEFVREVRREWSRAYGASTSTKPSETPPAGSGWTALAFTLTFCGPV